jgi:SAM-dependent methyltransferase
MNTSALTWCVLNLKPEEVRGKRILEVGSQDVNGSLRPIVESWAPAEYVGVDIEKGRGVDVVCPADQVVRMFGRDRFDVVVCTEVLEHVREWRGVVSNLKNVCASGGLLIVTTRSLGFEYHAYPDDFWRYEPEDIRVLFADCRILALDGDRLAPGVFVKLSKPWSFHEADLSAYALHSVVTDTKQKGIGDEDFRCAHFRRMMRKKKVRALLSRGARALIGS